MKKAIHDNSLSSQISEKILTRIVEKRLVPGDPIPTESKMSEEFGVSRNIVREAVGRLKGLGIIIGRKGSGLEVGQNSIAKAFAQILPLFAVSHEDNIEQLWSLRFVIEVGSVEFAVERITDKQISELKKICKKMKYVRSLPGDNHEWFNELEIRFHSIIVGATGLDLLKDLSFLICRYFHYIEKHIDWEKNHSKDHESIIQAFEKRNTSQVRSLLIEHLKEGWNDIKQKKVRRETLRGYFPERQE